MDQIRRKLPILSHILNKSLMENLIFLCSEKIYQIFGIALIDTEK